MSRRYTFDLKVLVAVLCLLGGSLKPAYVFISSFSPQPQSNFSKAGESEDQDSLQDSETETDEDIQKIMLSDMEFITPAESIQQRFSFYTLIFKEHHPELITPPPRG